MSRISPSSRAEEQHLQSPQQSQGGKITFYRLPSHSEETNAFPISVFVTGVGFFLVGGRAVRGLIYHMWDL